MTIEGPPDIPPNVLSDDYKARHSVALLVEDLEAAAQEALRPPNYEVVPTFEQFTAAQSPKLANRAAADTWLGIWHRSRLRRLEAAYNTSDASSLREKNDKLHSRWRSQVASAYTRSCAIAWLGGHYDEAEEYLKRAETWGSTSLRSANIGLALLAKGAEKQGKEFLLAGSSQATGLRAHNMLDAYRVTGDKAYRQAMLEAAGEAAPYLIGRLVLHDQTVERPIDDYRDTVASLHEELDKLGDGSTGSHIDYLTAHSDWGNHLAGQRLLDTGQAREAALTYRNVLRDLGPSDAVRYLDELPTSARKQAAFHTLLAFALQGYMPERSPVLEEPVDDYATSKDC